MDQPPLDETTGFAPQDLPRLPDAGDEFARCASFSNPRGRSSKSTGLTWSWVVTAARTCACRCRT